MTEQPELPYGDDEESFDVLDVDPSMNEAELDALDAQEDQ